MRILALGKYYAPYRGGMESLLQACCEGFARLGAQVECVVANDRLRSVREELNGVRVRRLASLGTIWSTAVCPAYLGSTRQAAAELWHAHLPNPLADLACWLGPRRTPLVLSYHSDVVRQAAALRLYRPLLEWLLRRAARIVVATPAHIEYSPWLTAHRAKCDVIPYGIQLERFALSPALAEAAAQLRRQAGGRPIVLNVGRLVAYKGQRYLIEAARALEAVVWIAGEGPLRRALEQLAREAAVADRVKFWGELSDTDLLRLLTACDVFAFPSITANEAFGVAQLEAMACGKPVVSCALRSGVPLVNQDGVTGLVVPPADGAALAGALGRLLSDGPYRARLGAQARHRVGAEFAESLMIERYWALFQQLIARTQAA